MHKQKIIALCAVVMVIISACGGKQRNVSNQSETALQSGNYEENVIVAINDTISDNEVFTEYDTIFVHDAAEKGYDTISCPRTIVIDTLAFPQLRFNCKDRGVAFFMQDTIMNNVYIKYGNALSLDDRNRIIFYPLVWDSLKVENRAEELKQCLLGNAVCMMVDPIDGKDLIYLDRKKTIEILKLKRDTTYFASRIDQLCFGNLSFDGIKGDTIIFTTFFGLYDSDFGYALKFKILKEQASTHLWVTDISDEIVWDD